MSSTTRILHTRINTRKRTNYRYWTLQETIRFWLNLISWYCASSHSPSVYWEASAKLGTLQIWVTTKNLLGYQLSSQSGLQWSPDTRKVLYQRSNLYIGMEKIQIVDKHHLQYAYRYWRIVSKGMDFWHVSRPSIGQFKKLSLIHYEVVFISPALSTTVSTSGWNMYVQQYARRVLLVRGGKQRVINCECSKFVAVDVL